MMVPHRAGVVGLNRTAGRSGSTSLAASRSAANNSMRRSALESMIVARKASCGVKSVSYNINYGITVDAF